MRLIAHDARRYHVSLDTVLELERAILADNRVAPVSSSTLTEAARAATRVLGRAGLDAAALLRSGRRAATTKRPERDFFAVMMTVDPSLAAPWFVLPSRRSIYLFDAWPSQHLAIRSYVETWGIEYAFVSSSQAAERLASISDRCTFIWVPEGIEPSSYQQRSLTDKDIDVLQLGRRFDTHHAVIAPALEKSGRSYMYEREKGRLVFPTRDAFTDGLARSRVSICVPSSVTHPARAGDIETMTIRYLQSMMSKCVVLGRAPDEMIELFGYNPVVEIDMNDPAGQIIEILNEYERYAPLLEKNFETVCRDHTWAKRWERMSGVLFPD